MSESTFEIVKAALIDKMGLDPDEVKPESLIADDLGADSLDAVELIMALEEQLDITINEGDSENLKTVADVARLIDKLSS